jgi:hypothetical protein
MRIKCIGCEVLACRLHLAAAYSWNSVDVTLVGYGLHQRPAERRARTTASPCSWAAAPATSKNLSAAPARTGTRKITSNATTA